MKFSHIKEKKDIEKRQKYLFICFIVISYSLQITLSANAQSTFSSDRIYSAATNFLKQSIGEDIEVKFINKIPDVYFDESGVTAKCSLKGDRTGVAEIMTFRFFDGEKLLRNIEIPVLVKIYKNAAVAQSILKSGTKLNENDFTLRRMEILQADADGIADYSELSGSELKATIRKGAIIKKKDIEKELIIKRGDKVIIQVQSGAVRIRATGFAMQDARSGESIKFKFDNNIMQGYVAEDGTVLMNSNMSNN